MAIKGPPGVPLRPPVAASATGAAAESSGVPKWVWGLAIGVPVSAALLYILFGPSDEDKKKKKGGKKTPQKSNEKKLAGSKKSDSETAKASPKKSGLPEVEDVSEEEPKDPLDKALAAKKRGNKYFGAARYELAIKCYTEAIEQCPKEKATDLAIFYQNRAAAYHKLEDLPLVLSDCDNAINLNNKYVKALDRRANVLRKQAMKMEDLENQIEKLSQALEDITSVCLMEGFQKQEHMVLVDAILKELGRAKAAFTSKNREPVLTSVHFIKQYYTSFSQDPIIAEVEKLRKGELGDTTEAASSGFVRALRSFDNESYETIIADCSEEINSDGSFSAEARLLRGTFYLLQKQQNLAFEDFSAIIKNPDFPVKVKVNALIKRASLYIQLSKDPTKDPELSIKDFDTAAELDPDNADIYHHRGQIHLLIDSLNKAMVDFNRCITLNPNFPTAYAQKLFTDYKAAGMIGDMTKMKEVVSQLEESVNKFPDCVETYALCAQVLSDQQEFSKADDIYKRALLVDNTNANLLVHRALLALQWKGDPVEAIKLIEDALTMDEKCEFAYETLSTIEIQKGNLKRAVELLEKAIPLANTELEMAHLYGLREAAIAQIRVSQKYNIPLASTGMM